MSEKQTSAIAPRMEDDIRKAINEHLPSFAAEAVREKLSQLAEYERSIEELKGLLEQAREECGEATTENRRLKGLVKRADELDEREKQLDERERNDQLEQHIMKVQMEKAEQRAHDFREMFSMVFRNTEIRRTLHTTRPEFNAVMDHQGNYTGASDSNQVEKTDTETTEQV